MEGGVRRCAIEPTAIGNLVSHSFFCGVFGFFGFVDPCRFDDLLALGDIEDEIEKPVWLSNPPSIR